MSNSNWSSYTAKNDWEFIITIAVLLRISKDLLRWRITFINLIIQDI